ncbi:RNB domain-containing ribonuclease, partial [Myxococcota bacterium]|nr:RNB domain-containing ribonuclease [Myxococcota bacterium]
MDLRGNTKLVPTGKIFLTLPHTVSGANQAALAELSSLYNDALDTDDDIESMWELVRDEGTSVALPDLAELLWENPSNRQLLGLFLSLYGDSVWFKRKGDLWEPKSERHVAERLAQIEKQRQTEQLRENFGRHIDQILSSETTLDEKQWEGFLSQLRSLALLGDDFQGPAFLGDMVKELSRKHHFSSAPLWYGAFTILERLGIFLHHEDLDLLRFNPPPDLEDYSLLPSDPRSNSTLTLVVTIDDASTRDVDDAIACSPCSDGWKVSVCIADPASVIEPGSTLDLHTRRRATSLYRPDGTHHMLPERLSCDLLSLGEGVARSCLIFSAHIDPQGRVSNQEIIEGCVTVTHRLTYDQVDDLLKDHIESPLGTTLGDLTTIADLLYHGRQEAGCLEFPFPEAK